MTTRILEAYDISRDELEEFGDAPDLNVVYENFIADLIDEDIEEYEEFFGNGATPRLDWMHDIGLDPTNVPTLTDVAHALNSFRLPYYYHDVLYNYFTRPILTVEEVDDDSY